MIELMDAVPDVNVQPAEYKRLLGYPRAHVLEGPARDLADRARAWYLKHGQPWVYAREAQNLTLGEGAIVIDGVTFSSKRLLNTLKNADAHGAILMAVSAGPEVEQESQKLWLEEKPDEYFFLEMFGSAVVEHLVTMAGARLCAWADRNGLAVLPHYSPGYPEWDIGQQPRLLELIRATGSPGLTGSLEVLDSGMLRPKKSLLAAFGLTRHTTRVSRLTDLNPCENCSFIPCQYRRAAYVRAPEHSEVDAPPAATETPEQPVPGFAPLDPSAKYLVNTKALERWAAERLTLNFQPDGSIDALFFYEGTTCSNMGRAIRFHYTLKLGPREQGYPIREQKCGPAPGDDGHTYMCRYMNNAEHLMVAIDHEKPLLGHRLNDVLTWNRPTVAAGCYCEPASRKHKWGLVFETIHYALVQRQKTAAK